ncbi:lysozyme inhibitor LprI family protein [Halomonas vilamensis]|uniref:Lysozyme inhibitor LprI family protein n=1 Tax=Vreelandella vilamensis TaxID=531309 RepID=A0ABU1H973_9GAMM|nr:lysozyme inhibitor LprI family protein [Halomonas vilamensis]MDR5900411.1 lysozyme inhibitor LprI family protein [Halomonas vilamensis]
MMKRALAGIFYLALSPVTQAEDLYTKSYASCMDESGGVTVNMMNCIGAEIERQDAQLNGAYHNLRSNISDKRQQELLGAQRLWIQYRDANCLFYATAGGTLAMVASNECVLRETAQRAEELENLTR